MLFKQTFSKLTVSPQFIQEVIEMTETKKGPKKFILRRLLIAALAVALAFALAMGANAASGGELFESVVSFVSYTVDGQAIAFAVNSNALEEIEEDGTVVYHFKETGDGKMVMGYKSNDGKTSLIEIEPGSTPQELVDQLRDEMEKEKSPAAETGVK